MPEDPEIETEKLRDAVHEEVEREGGRFLRAVALTTAVLAALAALASLRAGDTVNEALVLKTEAARLQGEASDQWAYYQAKGVKAAVEEASRAAWLAASRRPPADFEQARDRYATEQAEIERKARELEARRDERAAEADRLLRKHKGFADAVALFQVAIALGAVAALTRYRAIWIGSVALGLAGLGLTIAMLLR